MDTAERVSEAKEKSEAARRVLENPAVVEAFAALRGQYLADFENSGPSQDLARNQAWVMLHALEHFKKELHSTLEGGRIAEFNVRSKLR